MNNPLPHSSPTHPGRKTWPAWTMLAVGMLITIFASLHVKQGIEADAVKQMAFSYDQATLKIQARLHAYALVLRGAAGLFAGTDTVTRQDWHAFVEKLHTDETVPGVQGIGFAQLIPPDQLASHIAQIRQEGFPDYSVRPPGMRAVITSIIYLEPFSDRNLRAFGFDMFSEPVRRAAMEQARDTGTAALSGKVELVQETGTKVQAGTLMYVPVYRNAEKGPGSIKDSSIEPGPFSVAQRRAALLGWAYSPYRMNDLMSGILQDWEHDEGRAINLHIYDGPQEIPDALLFDNKKALSHNAHSLFRQQRTIDFYGHRWLLVFDHAATAASLSYATAWSALGGGMALSALLFGLMLSMINTQANAVRIAAELTEQVRRREELLTESELRYRTMADFTADWEYWLMPDGKFRYVSPSCEQISGYAAEEFYADPKLLTQIIHPDDQQLWAEHSHHMNAKGVPEPIDYRLRGKDGAYLWISHVCRPVVDATGQALGIRGSNREITARKNAEAGLARSNADLQRFAEVTAHHLQEPARRLASYAERLRQQLAGRLDAADATNAEVSLDFIGQQARRMKQLLGDIERYLAADQPRGMVESTDAGQTVAALLAHAQERIGAVDAEITVGALPPAWIDAPRLTDLFEVALDNALQHGGAKKSALAVRQDAPLDATQDAPRDAPPAIPLRITVEGERVAALVRYRVSDNGPGIEAQYRERVFRVFERLSSGGESTGIGLAIVRRIAENCGGRAWLEETTGGGCSVLFELPAEKTS